MTKLRAVLLTMLLATLPSVVLLAVLEGTAYVLGVKPFAADEQYLFHVNYRRHQFGYAHPKQHCDPKLAARPGKTTILTLGGSSVRGYIPLGVPFFPERLERHLNAAYPGEYAVVNLGRVMKNSTFVRKCVEHAIRADPDVIVLYSGHNDYTTWGSENPARDIFWDEHAPWVYDVLWAVSHSRGFSAVARLLTPGAGRVPPLAEVSDEDYQAARAVILGKYTANVSSIIDLADRHGVQVILITVVSNLHDFPLRSGEWIGPPTQAEDPERARRWHAHFTRGHELFGAGRFDDALRELKLARDERCFGRALSELNDTVRRLARSRPNVHLVDFERQLDRIGKAEGIGCNFFGDATYCDQFHPNARTHRLLGKALFRKLQALRERRRASGTASSTR